LTKHEKSKDIGQTMQVKKDKYKNLHEIIEKSTADAEQGIKNI
jgi:hypothetical protein